MDGQNSQQQQQEEEEEEDRRGQQHLLEPEDALDRFKVDIAALEDGPAARIVLFNVNLPR